MERGSGRDLNPGYMSGSWGWLLGVGPGLSDVIVRMKLQVPGF
jgi:hypothetical protein